MHSYYIPNLKMSQFDGFNSWFLGEKTINKLEDTKPMDSSEMSSFRSQMIDSIWNDVFPARDTKSIWATPNPYSSDGKNLSLSVPGIPWPLSHQFNEQNDGHGAPDELWDSTRDPPIEQNTGHSNWKINQTATDSLKLPLSTVSDAETCRSTSETSIIMPTTTSIITDPCGKITPPGGSVDDSATPAVLSMEQLCDHLINNNEGWGKRPVDQSIPWELPDTFKAKSEPLTRDSGITTPTPGFQPNTASFVSGSRIVQPPPLNEVLTGTGIWELHYETLSARSSGMLWSNSTLSHPQVPAGSTPQPSILMLDSSSSPTQSGADPLTQSTSSSTLQRPCSSSTKWWDNGDRMWNVNDIVPSTSRAHLGTRGIVGGTNSVQQDELNWYNAGLTADCSLSSPFDCSAGANTWGDCFSSTIPNTQWSPMTSVSPFMLSGTDDFRGQQLLSTTPQSHADRMPSHPFNNNGTTDNGNNYRVEMVKFLMAQGFKKDDVLAVLIDNNMNLNRALHELRQHNASRCQSTAANQQQLHHVVNSTNGVGGQLSNNIGGPTSTSVGGINHSIKQVGGYLSSSVSNGPTQQSQTSSFPVQPNPQMMRSQLIQQVRTALNLPPPNSMSGSPQTGNFNLTATGGGNSLLGQPPPPILNGTAAVGGSGGGMPLQLPPLLSVGGSGVSSAAPGGPSSRIVSNGNSGTPHHHSNNSANHNISGGSGRVLHGGHHHNTQTPPSYGSHTQQQNKQRSPRQLTIINAIHELEKKLQAIQQQLSMYQNNSVMCAQPQYADVFTELQGQMHQIKAQISAKQAQLSLVIAHDAPTAPLARSHHQQQQQRPFNQSSHLDDNVSTLNMNGFGQQSTAHTSSSTNSTPQGRVNQDHLVRQLMELKLRSGNAANTSDGSMDAGDFPTIGMWSAQQNRRGTTGNTSSDCGSQEGNILHGGKFFSAGPRSLTNARGGISKQLSMGSPGSSGWLSTNAQSQSMNHQRSTVANGNISWHALNIANSGMTMEQQQNGSGGSGLSGFKSHQNTFTGSGDSKQSVAPWLLVHPVNGTNLNFGLQNLLAQFGLLQFHVLNPTTGTSLVRLQSAENALQLMRAVGNRVVVLEPLTHSQALTHLQQQRNATALRPDSFNHPSAPVMMDPAPVHPGNGGPSWSNNFNGANNNDVTVFGGSGGAVSRKSVAASNTASRHRMMVSGMHF